jgi:mono/diheme cytochrome c family protein
MRLRIRNAAKHIVASAVTAGALLAAAAFAQQSPSPGDPAVGKLLHDKDCVACHARRYDGDATQIYLRPEHRVKTPAQLRAQVAYCNTQLGTGYFPDEEEHLATYLNSQYYKFKP